MIKNRELVHVRVVRHLPQGLSVELDNGERGIIRAREISWDSDVASNWKNNYPIGWDGYAFRIPAKQNEAREFSLRLAESDPWDDFFEDLDKSERFEGVVTGVFEYGAFIEIAPGITGLLHKSQIPSAIQISILDLFWHGDKVFVTVRGADQTQRQIDLGIAPTQNLSDEDLSATQKRYKVKDKAKNESEKILGDDLPRRHILVVENEEMQSEAICGWLRKLGQSVDAVRSAEEALAFLEKTSPDIALVDVGLPNASGTELVKIILENYPQVQAANMTDWARANEIKNALDELQALGGKLLYKPLLPEDLAAYLLHEQDQRAAAPQAEEKLALSNIPKLNVTKSIRTLLAMCKKQLDAEQVFLFSLDAAHRRINIADRVGDGAINKNAVAQLIYSPVRDAAEDGEVIVENEINERERKRFQHLLAFSPAAVSCIGVPVPAQTTLKYALFALDPRAKRFDDGSQMYAQGMALALGAALDQSDLRERSALIQRSALIGNLASGMMHEMNNLAGPLLFEADTIKKSLARILKDETSNYANINIEIANIEKDVRQIISVTKAFGKIATKANMETLRVDEIVENTLLLLREIGKRSRVKFQFNAPEKLVIVRNQSVTLEQIFLNVVLNAVQQIAEWRKDGEGHIQINMELLNEAQDAAMCRILVADNGPGIHTVLWEKIFEMGFSTRKDGSGIGLHVSRSLMEDIGGKIYVVDSHILSGSVFALEFPIHL